jgi:hypothetical protein
MAEQDCMLLFMDIQLKPLRHVLLDSRCSNSTVLALVPSICEKLLLPYKFIK